MGILSLYLTRNLIRGATLWMILCFFRLRSVHHPGLIDFEFLSLLVTFQKRKTALAAHMAVTVIQLLQLLGELANN